MKQPKEKFNIAIVDDHFATANGYKQLMHQLSFVKIIDTYTDAGDFILASAEKNYDFVMLDICLKKQNGVELCSSLKEKKPELKILMMSFDNSIPNRNASREAGADGFIGKDMDAGDTVKTIFNILTLNTKEFPETVPDIYIPNTGFTTKTFETGQSPFTKRELEILSLICIGKSIKQMSTELFIEESTIIKHKQNIMKKAGVHTVAELYRFAFKGRLFKPF